MYDTIIIGAGPCGMTAAIYASRREMKTLIISKTIGGQVVWASDIENYPGFKSIQSFELIQKMKEQVEGLGVEIKESEVKEIKKTADGNFEIFIEKESFKTKTVIIAMGLSPRRLAIPGEEDFNGRGVTYCANCDGPFYRDKDVVVVGGGNSALDAAEMLSKIAKQVYLVHRSDKFKAFEALQREVRNRENIEVCTHNVIKQIVGENKVEKVILESTAKEGETREIPVDGVFIEIGRVAHTDLVEGLADRNERKEILVDDCCRTKTEGVFAAGDVTQIPFKQISSANGQGTIAALSAYQYLQLREEGEVKPVFDRSVHN